MYRWDALDRLSRVETRSGQVVARYAYDAMNRRVRKEVTSAAGVPDLVGVTLFFHDASQLVEELFSLDPTDPGQPFMTARQYVYGPGIDQPCVLDRYAAGAGSAPLDPASANLTQVALGAGVTTQVHRLYYATNSLGSVFGLTNTAPAIGPGEPGAHLVEAAEYDPYGGHTLFAPGGTALSVRFDGTDAARSFTRADRGVRSSFDNPFLFTGRYFDAETGLHQYRNRYYDAVLGRFLSADPSGYGDSLNLYEYVGGNPLNAVDPYGYAAQALAGAAAGALAGGVSSAVSTLMSGGSLTDALVEGAIGAIEGAITAGLACAGLPPTIASAIGNAVAAALRAGAKHLMKAFECGGEIDWHAMLSDMAEAALLGALEGLVTGGVLGPGSGLAKRIGDKFGLGDKIGRMGPCAQGVVSAAANGAIGAGMSALTGENCFLAGTLVKTARGMQPIEDVQQGDRVWSRDPATGQEGWREVTRLFRNTTRVVVKVVFRPVGRGERHDVGREGGESSSEGGEDGEPPSAREEGSEQDQAVLCTPGHAWLLAGGTQIHAAHLLPGHVLRDDRGGLLEVVSVDVEQREAATYNFEVEGWHTYFVAEREGAPAVWVHNTSPNVGTPGPPTYGPRDPATGRATGASVVLPSGTGSVPGGTKAQGPVPGLDTEFHDRGHLVAKRHGGRGILANEVPIHSDVNQTGGVAKVEARIDEIRGSGRKVRVDVEPRYRGPRAKVPTHIDYTLSYRQNNAVVVESHSVRNRGCQ